MVPGLLPIFFHGYEIKSGSGLGTRLAKYYFHTYKVNRNHTPFMNILKVKEVKYLWVHVVDIESTNP